MDKLFLFGSKAGYLAIRDGEKAASLEIPADKAKELNAIVAQRRKLGLELTQKLREHGMDVPGDDVPTAVVGN